MRFVRNLNYQDKNENKNEKSSYDNCFWYLVAGEGFEPTTFGL